MPKTLLAGLFLGCSTLYPYVEDPGELRWSQGYEGGSSMLNLFPREDTYSYRGWIVSDHFWKRAFGIFGYGLAAEIVIFLVMLLIFVVLELGLRLILP
jgi:hypothetical protein